MKLWQYRDGINQALRRPLRPQRDRIEPMAALAESLVDEWLNRQGFFTVRGVRTKGVDEVDLLGVRPTKDGTEGWHVEVQASFRPVSYISRLTKEDMEAGFGRIRTSAKRRPGQIIQRSADAWVDLKFKSKKKVELRDQAWPGVNWRFVFVHGMVKEPLELECIAAHDVNVIPLYNVLSELRHEKGRIRGIAGTDISEVIEYFNDHLGASNAQLR